MKCPLCNSDAPFEETDTVDDSVTVEYRCDDGHIIQFLLPEFLFTLLIINDDGDELYRLCFDADKNITQLQDWRWFPEHHWFSPTDVDLEGTGVEREEE